MESLKIENFQKLNANVSFPLHQALSPESSNRKKIEIASRLRCNNTKDGLALVKFVDELGELRRNFDAQNISFRLNDVFTTENIIPASKVYINWYRYDDIDKLNVDDLNEFFSDIWYPGVDDIDIFDDTLAWIISVSHSGAIKVLRLNVLTNSAVSKK